MRPDLRTTWCALTLACGCGTSDVADAPGVGAQAEIIPFRPCADRTSCEPCPDGMCEVHFWSIVDDGNAPPANALAPTGSHVCVLSGVHGALRKAGLPFGVFVRNTKLGERWFLGGNSITPVSSMPQFGTGPCPDDQPNCNDMKQVCTLGEDGKVDCLDHISFSKQALSVDLVPSPELNGDGAYATCVPLSRFQTDQDGVVWTSDIFHTSASQGRSSSVNMWWGDSASFISTLGVGPANTADFDYAANAVTIEQGGPSTPSRLHVKDGSWFFGNDDMGGVGISLFVGVPHTGDTPSFYSSAGVEETRVSVHESQRRSIDLDQVDSALCYLTTVQGDFEGGGEWITLLPYRGEDGIWRWNLDVRAGGSSDGITAAARCIKYDQCKHPENGCIQPVGEP